MPVATGCQWWLMALLVLHADMVKPLSEVLMSDLQTGTGALAHSHTLVP